MSTMTAESTQVRGADVRIGDLIITAHGGRHQIRSFAPYTGTLAGHFGPGARTAYSICDGQLRRRIIAADDEVTVTLPRPPQHTITVETITAEIRHAVDFLGPHAVQAVVERRDGRLLKICATDADPRRPGVTLLGLARSYAELNGAALRVPYPEIVSVRADLADQRHTITIESVDHETAPHWTEAYRGDWRDLIGRYAVVERHNGRLAKVCCIAGLNGIDDTPASVERAARGTARTYGAEYVEAVR